MDYCCGYIIWIIGLAFKPSLLAVSGFIWIFAIPSYNMVNKCMAYGCKSGYKGHDSSDVTFHAFPLKNKDLCDKWKRANPRQDFEPTKYSKMCSLHFKPSDFVDERRDTNKQRMKNYADDRLVRRYLKDDAIPSLFPNAPDYLSNKLGAPRSTFRASAESRRESQIADMELLAESFMAEDDISHLDLEAIAERIKTEATLPHGFSVTLADDCLFLYLICHADGVPRITASITVRSNLSVVTSLEEKLVPVSRIKDLVDGSLTKMSQLVNLMARAKSWSNQPETRPFDLWVQMAIQCLKSGLQTIDDEKEECRVIQFIVEQLKLITMNKFGRHYSPQLSCVT